ncbi:hypothetical protein JTB14_025268 [Gonioctena quinquepunctata]|nr:hypothetical protein JTB14_025268 [Gonioctena quinquepunctata]
MTTEDVDVLEDKLIATIPDSKTHKKRIFAVVSDGEVNPVLLFKKAACKEFPNFKGFKFDQRQQHNVHKAPEAQRTANIQKYSSLGRRPLPQTPDEKARKQPTVPKVPTSISQCIETPLNPANFRSLQRGAWQDNVSSFQSNVQFRSLQRGVSSQPVHSQFRPAKIQDQAQGEAMYANSESERQLYAVTEL